ncbi:hypothetical protein VNO77_31723 [Canavalia gladiata]|uniref:Uncharacterized protein n=1 Tax=Canavalia gladiata TaxID=3824 RepID=A0AAN9Q7U9_CANGL
MRKQEQHCQNVTIATMSNLLGVVVISDEEEAWNFLPKFAGKTTIMLLGSMIEGRLITPTLGARQTNANVNNDSMGDDQRVS